MPILALTPSSDFFRLSRSSIDDSITQNLNALVTPAKEGFDPSSTSHRVPRPTSRVIDARSCRRFEDQVLFPSWQARTNVINYCAIVATSPDPDDPEVALREIEDEKNKEKVIDERLDPYSAQYFPREPRAERLSALIRQEKGIERIVRARTWAVMKGRCGESSETWEDALAGWKAKNAPAS